MPPNPAAEQPDPAASPNRRNLREVPGGYDIDRWPIAISIREGESVHCWLTRISFRYGIPPRNVLGELGIVGRLPSGRSVMAGVGDSRSTLAAALGVSGNSLDRALASTPLDCALSGYLAHYHKIDYTRSLESRFCPQCLAEPDHVWQSSWSSPLHLVCVKHEVLLRAKCPACEQGPWSTTAWLGRIADTNMCPQRRNRDHVKRRRRVMPFCRQDLSQAVTEPAKPNLVSAQQRLLDLAARMQSDPDRSEVVCGIGATVSILFDAYAELLDEAVGAIGNLAEVNHDSAALASALSVAHTVLSAPDSATAAAVADNSNVLKAAGFHTPVGPPSNIAARAHNPLLAAIRLRSVAGWLSPVDQLMFRTGFAAPRYPTAYYTSIGDWQRLPEHQPGVAEIQPAWIPQVLWPAVVTEFDIDDVDAPAALAMALAKVGSTHSWRHIALELGLPSRLGRSLPWLWKRVVASGGWTDVLARLESLSERLRVEAPPIDYQVRRIIADDHRQVVRAVQIAARRSMETRSVASAVIVRRFWELFTGGDIRYAQPPFGLSQAAYPTYRRISRIADLQCGQLFADGHALLANSGGLRPSGPLTWIPP